MFTRKPVLLALIFAALGLGLAGAAWSSAAEALSLASRGVRTEAQIVSVDRFERRGTKSYVPTFLFRTAEGRVVRERSSETLSSDQELASGRRVAVIYDPTDTSRVRLASSVDGGMGALPWVLGGLAAACLGLAGFALVSRPGTRGGQ